MAGNPAWKPGVSGNPNGRPRKLMPAPDEVLLSKGISPVLKILELINSGELKATDQLRAWLELLAYCNAKPKEQAVDANGFELLSDEELIKLLREKVPQLRAG